MKRVFQALYWVLFLIALNLPQKVLGIDCCEFRCVAKDYKGNCTNSDFVIKRCLFSCDGWKSSFCSYSDDPCTPGQNAPHTAKNKTQKQLKKEEKTKN